MRIVIDTNQIDSLRHSPSAHSGSKRQLVLPPRVWQEVLNSGYSPTRINTFVNHDIRFGFDVGEVYSRLSNMQEAEIRECDAVVPKQSTKHGCLRQNFFGQHRILVDAAADERIQARAHSLILTAKMVAMRKANNERRSRGHVINEARYSSIDDAMAALCSSAEDGIGREIVNLISDNGARSLKCASPQSLLDAMMANVCLRNFLRVVLCYHVGYRNGWACGELNAIDPSPNRNDLTDMTLALYAMPSDTIVTGDKYLQRVLRFIDTEDSLTVCTWNQLVQSH